MQETVVLGNNQGNSSQVCGLRFHQRGEDGTTRVLVVRTAAERCRTVAVSNQTRDLSIFDFDYEVSLAFS